MRDKTSIYSLRTFFTVIVLFLISSESLANVPSPIWSYNSDPLLASFLHSIFSGILEGLIVSFLLKAGKRRSVAIMILANFMTAIVGTLYLKLGFIKYDLLVPGRYDYEEWAWTSVFIVFLATLVLEFPFIFWIKKTVKKEILKIIAVGIFVQLLSFLFLNGDFGKKLFVLKYGDNPYQQSHFSVDLHDFMIQNSKLAAIEQIKVFSPKYSIIKTSHREVSGSKDGGEVEVSFEFKDAKDASYVQSATCRPVVKDIIFCHYALKNESGKMMSENNGEFVRKK